MREITFEIVTDPREVVVDRLWVDVVAHENSEETEGFGSRVNRTVMEMAESEIRVSSGII
jgi:hypothetical protein